MFDIPAFETWLKKSNLKKGSVCAVMRAVKNMYGGKSATINGKTFPLLINVQVTPELVDQKLCDDARNWAPRPKPGDSPFKFVDKTKGWSLHYPLQRLLRYKNEVLIPQREAAIADKMQLLTALDSSCVQHMRKRKTWTVRSHDANNTERVSSTAPFLDACFTHAQKYGYEWRYSDEFTFVNRQRCDLFMVSIMCYVVVESKTRNLLHGIGQVLHYNELASMEIPSYEDSKHFMVVVLSSAPSPLELKTAHKLNIHVWWPNEAFPLFVDGM